MKKHTKDAAITLAVLFCVSCAPGIRPDTREVQASELTGTYSVIFYGCNFLNDLETIAFLDKEGDRYNFEPFAPDFKFKVKKMVAAEEALAHANDFVKCNTSFYRSRLSKISAPNGDVVGYEIRPLYEPVRYGVDDVLYTNYKFEGEKVLLTVRLVPSVEIMLQDDGRRGKGK
jgi:hypothetical protein